MTRFRQRALALLVAFVAMFGVSVVVAQPAQAALVQGCTQGFCIDVYTGSKNHDNKTQWVERVEVYLGNGSVEAWAGSSWYASASSSSASWNVKKWIGTGHGVCGATPNGRGGRKIPCITIRV